MDDDPGSPVIDDGNRGGSLARAAIAARVALYAVERTVDGRRRVRALNPAFARLAALPPDTPADGVALDALLARIHPDDRPGVDAFWDVQRLLGELGGVVHQAYRVLREDGTVALVEDRALVSALPGGGVLLEGAIVDRTAQHSAEAARERAEADAARGRALLEGAAEAAGKHLYVSRGRGAAQEPAFLGPGLARIVGAPPQLGRAGAFAAFRSRVHPDDRRRLVDLERRAADAPGTTRRATYRVLGLDGRTRWVRHAVRAVPGADDLLLEGAIEDVTGEREAEERLRASEERFRAVVEHLPAGALRIDAGGVALNAAAERLTGWSREAIRTREDWEQRVLPLPAPSAPDDGATPPLSATLRTRAGVARNVDLSGVALDDGEVWLLVDTTAQVEAELELRAARDQAAALAAEFEELSRTDVLTALPNRRWLVGEIARRLDGEGRDRFGLLMIDIDGFKRINDVHGHAAGDEVLSAVGRRLAAALRRGGPERRADAAGRWGGEEFLVLLGGIHGERPLAAAAERLRRAVGGDRVRTTTGSEVAVTISLGGVVCARHPGLGLEALVDLADRALYAAKRRGKNRTVLADEIGEAEIETRAFDALLTAQAMAVAASAREGVGEAHPREVAQLAARIAGRLGLDPDAARRTLLAGWLHDVGKTAIPDQVLHKRGPLDADDWVVMRSHAEIGAQIAQRAGIREAVAGVLHHHERWDGAGYPAGLAGEAIPIEARIVAAADAYSAITSERAYKPARPHADALRELARAGGSHLDPVVARVAIEVLEGRHVAPAPAERS